MTRKIAQLFFSLAVLALSTMSLSLAEEKPVELESKQSACFERFYTKAHLRNHPKQTVQWVRIEHPASDRKSIFATVKARFVGDHRVYSGFGTCSNEEKGQLSCGIDGDGGGYSLSEREDGKIILRPIRGMRVSASGRYDNEYDRPLRHLIAADDQNVFVLEKVGVKECKLKPL